MLGSVVIAGRITSHIRVIRIEHRRRVLAGVAIMMVRHIGRHIRLVVVQIDRFRLGVVGREIAIVIRRSPYSIGRTAEHIPDRWTFHEHRTDDIVISIQVPITYHLHIQRAGPALSDERSYILKHTGSQTSLDQHRVVIAAVGLDHTQVIDPSVAVQIQVIDHIPTGVENLLKLTYRTALSECCSHGIEVQIETRIAVVGGHGNRVHRGVFRCRSGHRGRINGLYRSHRLNRRSHREDTSPAASQHEGQRN